MSAGKRRDDVIREVIVEPELCMNFRNCLRIAKGAFIGDPKTGKTRPGLWQRVEPEALWKAAWSCPSGAIRFVTDRGYLVPRWDEAAAWDVNRHPAAAQHPDRPVEKY